jgi:itaconate CoA-transferase
MRDIWEHAQLKARARWTEVASPVGALPALLPPGVPNTWTARMDAIPELGQHTQSILSELGYDAATISQLQSEKAI